MNFTVGFIDYRWLCMSGAMINNVTSKARETVERIIYFVKTVQFKSNTNPITPIQSNLSTHHGGSGKRGEPALNSNLFGLLGEAVETPGFLGDDGALPASLPDDCCLALFLSSMAVSSYRAGL